MYHFKIIDGSIFMGNTPVMGHGCKTVEEMQQYCKAMNAMIDPEDAIRAKRNSETISRLSKESRQSIIDALKMD